ncbi:MAG: AmmeMemoRadiSam system protein B [Magnetococcales bacterium]|nr:AmmeMemoRadiSam system protein B [Magnetococcales bacterium]
MNVERVRPPAVAGMFYPGDARALRDLVEGLLEQVPPPSEEPLAVISPHAGFIYSGLTAAHAYKGLSRAPATAPRRVFLVGPSHRVWLEGASVGNYDAYVTPMGRIPVDQQAVSCLASHPDVTRDDASHRLEHSLETQLPFLQVTLVNFRIVPIVYGEMSGGQLADLLEMCWKPGDLIVISTDLSHFHTYDEAKRLDARSNEAILSRDIRAMSSCEACGNTGVRAVLETARRQRWIPRLMDLRNSGDTAGDRQRVVGYASYLFHPEGERVSETPKRRESPASSGAVSSALHSPADGTAPMPATAPAVSSSEPSPTPVGLPELVREHLASALSGGRGLPASAVIARQEALAKPGACFVTLTAGGALRGCIGSLVAHRALAEDLLENGLSAAIRDPRFPPVGAAELAGLAIEVSLLTAPVPFPYRDEEDLLCRLKRGVHGVILSKQGRRATFLPQVWEQLPDPVDFLGHLCRKAGLDGGCWRHGAEIQVYTVEKQVERRGGG